MSGNRSQFCDQHSPAGVSVLLAPAGSLFVFPDQFSCFFRPAEHTALRDTVGFAHTAAFRGLVLRADPSTCTCLDASGIPPLPLQKARAPVFQDTLPTKLAGGSSPHLSQVIAVSVQAEFCCFSKTFFLQEIVQRVP